MKLITVPWLEAGWTGWAQWPLMPGPALDVDQIDSGGNLAASRNLAALSVQANPIIHRPREDNTRVDIRDGSWAGSVGRRFGSTPAYKFTTTGAVSDVVAGPAVAGHSAFRFLCAPLNRALASVPGYHRGKKVYHIADLKEVLKQFPFAQIWREVRESHTGIGEVCVTLCIHYSGDNVSAICFNPTHGALPKAPQCSLTTFIFSPDGVVRVATCPERQKPREVLLSLFDNEEVSLTGEALQHAAIFFIEKEFMHGYEHIRQGWPAIPKTEFPGRWAKADFKAIWQKVKRRYPDLESVTAVFSINFDFTPGRYGAPAFKHPDSRFATTGKYVFARLVFSDDCILTENIWGVSRGQAQAAQLYGYSHGSSSLTVARTVHEKFEPVHRPVALLRTHLTPGEILADTSIVVSVDELPGLARDSLEEKFMVRQRLNMRRLSMARAAMVAQAEKFDFGGTWQEWRRLRPEFPDFETEVTITPGKRSRMSASFCAPSATPPTPTRVFGTVYVRLRFSADAEGVAVVAITRIVDNTVRQTYAREFYDTFGKNPSLVMDADVHSAFAPRMETAIVGKMSFEDAAVALEGENLDLAACAYVEKNLMGDSGPFLNRHRLRIPREKFEQILREYDFETLWQRMRGLRPALSELEVVLCYNADTSGYAVVIRMGRASFPRSPYYGFALLRFGEERVVVSALWDRTITQNRSRRLLAVVEKNPTLTISHEMRRILEEQIPPAQPMSTPVRELARLADSESQPPVPAPEPENAAVPAIVPRQEIAVVVETAPPLPPPLISSKPEPKPEESDEFIDTYGIRARGMVKASAMESASIAKGRFGYPSLSEAQLRQVLQTLDFGKLRKKLWKSFLGLDELTVTFFFIFGRDGNILLEICDDEFELPSNLRAATVRIHFNNRGVFVQHIQDNDRAEAYKERLKRLLGQNRTIS